MRILILLFFALSLYGTETCYTVQLLSRTNSQSNAEFLQNQEYPAECKIMQIGNSITVRCGCYKKINSAKSELLKFQTEYEKAQIAITYKSRFQDVSALKEHGVNPSTRTDMTTITVAQAELLVSKITGIVTAKVEPDTAAVLNSTLKHANEKDMLTLTVSAGPADAADLVALDLKTAVNVNALAVSSLTGDIQNITSVLDSQTIDTTENLAVTVNSTNNTSNDVIEDENKTLEVPTVITPIAAPIVTLIEDPVSSNMQIVEEPKPQIQEEKKVKKEKKTKKKKKKSKKDKEPKTKYLKKRDADFSYTRYLDMFKNKKGEGSLDYRYEFGAQVSYDLAYINEAEQSYRVADWRRLRVYHKGSFLDETLFYEGEYSFTGTSKYKDVYVGYQNSIKGMNTDYRVKFGNIKIPFSLEQYSSSKYITFMERSLNDVFGESRKVGAEVLLSTHLNDSRLNFFGSLYSNSIDERIDNESQKPGYSTRVTYGYKFNKNHLLSVGGSFLGQEMNGEEMKFKQGSESEWIENKYVSVKIKDVDNVAKKNLEALYIYNRYSLQAEYGNTSVHALKDDYSFSAYYVQGSYFILGNGRRYSFDTSTLSKIKPNKDTSVELAFRYSHVNLNDKDEHGGMQTDYTYALNWYITKELKLMANYIVAQPKGTDDYDGLLQVVQARVLFAF
jgi:phosphate-selective porin OprO/OprP